MNKNELIECQKIIGITGAEMARALEIPYVTYYKWVSGEKSMTSVSASAVNLLMFIHRNGLYDTLADDRNVVK